MLRNKGWCRCFSILLLVILLAAQVLPSFAGEEGTVYLYSSADLMAMAVSCTEDSYSGGRKFILMADIDLGETDFSGIPILNGTFEGNGHSITGLRLTGKHATAGLFRYIAKDGTVRNLTVEGYIETEGTMKSALGILTGQNEGLVENCVTAGFVTGTEDIGGIAGINKESGRIIGSFNQAEVKGELHTGGIAGKNEGLIRDCFNEGLLNGHNEASFTDTGGIAGWSSGVIEGCENRGEVGYPHNGYNTGGIAGIQGGLISRCKNYAAVSGRKDVGGITGQFDPYVTYQYGPGMLSEVSDELGRISEILKEITNHLNDGIDDGIQNLQTLGGYIRDLTDLLDDNIIDASDHFTDSMNDIHVDIRQIRDEVDELLLDFDDTGESLSRNLSGIFEGLDIIRKSLEGGLGDMDEAACEEIYSRLNLIEEATERIKSEMTGSAVKLRRIRELLTAAQDVWQDDSKGLMERLRELKGIFAELTAIDIRPDLGVIKAEMDVILKAIAELEASLGKLLGGASEDLSQMAAGVNKGFARLNQSGKVLGSRIYDLVDMMTARLTNIDYHLAEISNTINDGINDGNDRLHQASDDIGEVSDKIHNHLDDMADTLSDSNSELKSLADRLVDQLDTVRDVIADVEAPEFSVDDISDGDYGEGKGLIAHCSNQGVISGDINVGGVAGNAAREFYEDPEEELDIKENLLTDITMQLRALMYGCKNEGTITVKKDYAGGIVGNSKVGAAVECVNTGDIEVLNGSYGGGIAGMSKNVIKSCYSITTVKGASYLGGIAGYGTDIQQCYGMALFEEGSEKIGAIAGDIDEEGRSYANYYVPEDTGGIDGISRRGVTDAISYEELCRRNQVPPELKEIKITFLAGSEVVSVVSVAYDGELPPDEIPQCPQLGGQQAIWPEFSTGVIKRSQTVEAACPLFMTVISSGGEPPAMLAEGMFTAESELLANALLQEEMPDPDQLPKGIKIFDGYHYEITGLEMAEEAYTFRVRGDKGADAIYFVTDDGLTPAAFERDGSYLLFTGSSQGEFIVAGSSHTRLYVLTGAALFIACGTCYKVLRRRRKQELKEEQEDDKR